MTCGEARELFSSRVDGLLAAGPEAALADHLEGCPGCRGEWARFSRMIELLHAVPEARAPAGFARRVLEAAGREPWHRRLLRGVFVPFHVKLPLEALAIVLVSTLVILLYRESPDLGQVAEPRQAYRAQAPAVPGAGRSADVEAGRARGERDAPMVKEAKPSRPREVPPASRPGETEEARTAPSPAGPRLEATEEARKAGPPAAPRRLAAPEGPFHVTGVFTARDREALDPELNDLVREVGGILVRDAERVGAGSVVEVVVSREAYPRLEAGLRRIGDFRVETRAPSFPAEVRVGLRISD